MAKILVVDILGMSLDLCLKLQQERHDVRLHIRNKYNKDIGDGMVNKVSAWQKYLGWADLVIFADSGFGNLPKKLRTRGKSVIGGTAITDKMENDREFGIRMCEVCGIPIPKYYTFDSFDKARNFINDNRKKEYVFKSFDRAPKGQTKILYPDTQKRVLEYLEDNMKDKPFMLQEFINGIEMSIGGWFNGKKFMRPVLPNFEYNKMGSLMIYKDKNKLFTETLEKAEHVLASEGYVGFINLSCIITKDGPYALEWVTGFDYPTTLVQDEIHKEDWYPFLMGLSNASTKTFKTKKNNWCTGIAIVTLPWPVEIKTNIYKDKPIFVKGSTDHVHFGSAKVKNNEPVTAGNTGYIAVTTGHGRDIETSIDYALKRAEKITIDDSYHRVDIGYKIAEVLPIIKRWGYISR